ncbi:MAG: ribosomal RNA small subunit methyltransferase A [Planctomycetes bacterium]|nr:ribosomal RNA small subunit methyltransferase A [Planctomycetota bacterium]
MSLKQEVLAALTGAGLSPLHRFGQNFMIDAAALQTLVAELALTADGMVVEVGPGTGVLTERLLAADARVTAVEIDHGLHDLLAARFSALIPTRLTLVHGDCLVNKNRLHPAIIAAAASGPWRLGANLPYDVALPVLLNAAALPRPPELAVVTVQWEAAERLCARPGQDAWGASAAVLQAAGRPRLLRKLPPDCFYPRPRVDSAILRWEPLAALPDGFGRWCRAVFAARRKVVVRALRDHGVERAAAESACHACGIAADRRLEGLDAPELLALHRAVGTVAANTAVPGEEGVPL